jgi:hypothetical protein
MCIADQDFGAEKKRQDRFSFFSSSSVALLSASGHGFISISPPDPRSNSPLSSTEFVEPPPPQRKFLGMPLFTLTVKAFFTSHL